MNVHASTSKETAQYHKEIGEPGGLDSNPYSANDG